MTDSIGGTIDSTSVDQVTSTGKDSPTAYVAGRCRASPRPVAGCRYWLTIADNKRRTGDGTPDVIGFLLIDGRENRVAYGTGPLREGDFSVESAND